MKVKKVTKEEAEKEKLQGTLKSIQKYYLNEPTTVYNIGERVQRGNVKKTIITEVIDNGKIYRVHEICSEHTYGKSEEYERDDYVSWMDIEPYVSSNQISEMERITEENDVFVNYSQRQIDGLLLTYYHSGIDMEPKYQRDLVWSDEDKGALIDSIFKNVDIGKFTFIYRSYKTNQKGYEILDGKQRLNAIIEFKEGRFKYKGITYFDLHPKDRGHFDNYPIAWGQVEHLTEKQKYRFFIKLNTTGKPQDLKHMEYVKELLEK